MSARPLPMASPSTSSRRARQPIVVSTPITTAGWSRLTGSVVGRPASGSRTIALAKPEAAAFGAPGPHDHGRRPSRAHVEEALAGRIGEEQLEHRLGGAVGGQRRLPRAVVDRPERELAAERRERAREDEPRRATVRAAGVDERAAAVQVDVERRVEVALRAAAHDRGEMDDRHLRAVERARGGAPHRGCRRAARSHPPGRRAGRAPWARRAGAARLLVSSCADDARARCRAFPGRP